MSPAAADARPVLVVGFGVTGRSVAARLKDRGLPVTVVEDRPGADAGERAAELGVRLVERPSEPELAELVRASRLVVPSPGVPVSHPVYACAGTAGVKVLAEIEVAWQELAAASGDSNVPDGTVTLDPIPELVAVTGTNGKTTVATLMTEMLNASGRAAIAAGNIGLPLIDAVHTDTRVIVAEVSSFQLQFTEGFHPKVSCWLNLAEDHLDWHPTLAHYRAAKARIWRSQGPGDVAVLNRDDPAVLEAADDPSTGIPTGTARVYFSISRPADFWVDQPAARLVGPSGETLVEIAELPRAFPHDLANALAAAAGALAAGATAAGCREVLVGFAGLPHRVQLVGDDGDVRWYDDSKATTPASVLAALAAFDSVVLIAGGRNKGLDLGVLAAAVPPVRAVVAIGDAAGEVEAAFGALTPALPLRVAHSMAEAVAQAGELARPGDAVLLSPGCASFDWYRSYAERGNDFTARVAERLGEPDHPVNEEERR